ncbi:hypothetical protein ACFS5L_27780 [Streptomyces phyllanthi]|uniref:Uncharacterized protein n=1 Tax=Streptomyces phyllanthi TaxID=1803180 RepID=A0A5N8W3R0_9ACTN|nr:hypothetical protein [Streptomyces phyllanthi]MPY40785.1 hypothetical protein [Streptomyces phyllanthi]
MSEQKKPSVLIIDDHPEDQTAAIAVLKHTGLDVEVCLPNKLVDDHLRRADVVAIDQYYEWDLVPHPDEIAYWPQDGLALAAVVSRRLAALKSHAAIVLRTGELGRLAENLPRAARVPLLSAQSGLDWILEKGEDENASPKLHQLAAGASSLRPFIHDQSSWNEGAVWLNLPESAPWSDSALAEVQVCRPPEHVVARYTAGSAWLRWFAHRVLPFPSFLISDLKAATLLGISLREFQSIVSDSESAMGGELRDIVYTGHLSGLVDRRWWRAGIESFVDTALLDSSDDLEVAEALSDYYERLHGSPVTLLPHAHPVVTIDADYAEDGVADAFECVRLAPDLWPVFADEPWALRDDAMDIPDLAAMVSRGDRGRLHSMDVIS